MIYLARLNTSSVQTVQHSLVCLHIYNFAFRIMCGHKPFLLANLNKYDVYKTLLLWFKYCLRKFGRIFYCNELVLTGTIIFSNDSIVLAGERVTQNYKLNLYCYSVF